MSRRIAYLLALELLFPVLVPALAWGWPPTFGTEFNFTSAFLRENYAKRMAQAGNADVGTTPDNVEKGAARDLANAIFQHCAPGCRRVEHVGKWDATEYRFEFADGWWFNVSADPAVIEVQTKPATLEEVKDHVANLRENLFAVAKQSGLTTEGLNSHLNIGAISAFGDDPEAFLRFFLDYANQPELASGIFGINPANAPPITHLDEDQKAALERIVVDTRAGRIHSMAELAKRIQSEVYTRSPLYQPGYHYQAVGLKMLNQAGFPEEDRPFELRAITQPDDPQAYFLLCELMQKRIEFLREHPKALRYIPRPKDEYTAGELAERFYNYVSEMGLDYRPYLDLLKPEIRKRVARFKPRVAKPEAAAPVASAPSCVLRLMKRLFRIR